MTPEEIEALIAQAEKKYPIGTKFIIPNSNGQAGNRMKGSKWFYGNNHNLYCSYKSDEDGGDENVKLEDKSWENGCVWYHKEWAKIISQPKKLTQRQSILLTKMLDNLI